MSKPESLAVVDKPVQQPENEVRIPSALLCPMDLKKLSLLELLEYSLQTNDDAGWNEFFHRTKRTIDGTLANRLRSWCYSYKDVIEDLRQQTYAKLLKDDKRLLRSLKCDTEGQLLSYIAMTAGSVAADYGRSEREERKKTESLDSELFRELPGPESNAHEIKQKRELVMKCLEKLECGAQDRLIFLLFYEQGYSAREIGELPSIQLPTRKVENILLRLVRRVKSELKPRGKGSGA